MRAPGEMQCREIPMCDGLLDDVGGWARDELDDAGWEAGFGEDLVDEVVGVSCGRGRFPDYDVADEGGCFFFFFFSWVSENGDR